MRLSNLADYAIVMLAAAARAGDVRLTATSLSEETGVPLPTVQKLVGRLAAADLLVSARGAGGGFRLARTPERISLADIVEAVEGPIKMTTCIEQGSHECVLETGCQMKPHWGAVNDALRGALDEVSLASLSRPPHVTAEGKPA